MFFVGLICWYQGWYGFFPGGLVVPWAGAKIRAKVSIALSPVTPWPEPGSPCCIVPCVSADEDDGDPPDPKPLSVGVRWKRLLLDGDIGFLVQHNTCYCPFRPVLLHSSFAFLGSTFGLFWSIVLVWYVLVWKIRYLYGGLSCGPAAG